MAVSKQLELCFGGVGNNGWIIRGEEGQIFLYGEELRTVMGSQVPADVCACGWAVGGLVGGHTFRSGWEEREEDSSEPGFQNSVQELGVET